MTDTNELERVAVAEQCAHMRCEAEDLLRRALLTFDYDKWNDLHKRAAALRANADRLEARAGGEK